MFDTYVTVVGNVLTAPEWRRTAHTQTLVTSFKVASTARRFDRENNKWVDGNSLRVRVTCWRRLAEGVASSVMTGDPVVVYGRMFTRDWVDGEGNHRTMYELEAVGVGHDLSRGRSKFVRTKSSAPTSEISDDESDQRALGEAASLVPADEVPAGPGDNDGGFGSDFAEMPVFAGVEAESVSDSARGDEPLELHEEPVPSAVDNGPDDDDLDDVVTPTSRGRRKARTPVPV
jgi:single-strand DNA-binding protein